MNNEVVIGGWCDLQRELFEGSWNGRIGRFRSPFAFRGHSLADHRLETSLRRLGGPYEHLERHLLRNFSKYSCREMTYPSFWHLLAVAQHHALPTRLLDWTYSPLVAAHFATCNPQRFDRDGVIWMVNFERAHRLLPPPLLEALQREGAQAFTVEMLASAIERGTPIQPGSDFQQAVQALETFDALAREAGPFVVFVEPPSLDERIVNQFALLSIMPSPHLAMADFLQAHPELYRRIIIPARTKWEIRDKLDQCNLTERVLFPGLDGLSQWLKRQYTPLREQ